MGLLTPPTIDQIHVVPTLFYVPLVFVDLMTNLRLYSSQPITSATQAESIRHLLAVLTLSHATYKPFVTRNTNISLKYRKSLKYLYC